MNEGRHSKFKSKGCGDSFPPVNKGPPVCPKFCEYGYERQFNELPKVLYKWTYHMPTRNGQQTLATRQFHAIYLRTILARERKIIIWKKNTAYFARHNTHWKVEKKRQWCLIKINKTNKLLYRQFMWSVAINKIKITVSSVLNYLYQIDRQEASFLKVHERNHATSAVWQLIITNKPSKNSNRPNYAKRRT